MPFRHPEGDYWNGNLSKETETFGYFYEDAAKGSPKKVIDNFVNLYSWAARRDPQGDKVTVPSKLAPLIVRTRWSGTRKCSFQRMKMFSRCAMFPMGIPTFALAAFADSEWLDPLLLEDRAARTAGLYCRNAVNLLQWFISIRSVAPQLGCCVRNPYLLPIISPSKYVVRVGLSSVRPTYAQSAQVNLIPAYI